MDYIWHALKEKEEIDIKDTISQIRLQRMNFIETWVFIIFNDTLKSNLLVDDVISCLYCFMSYCNIDFKLKLRKQKFLTTVGYYFKIYI